jgi:BirA family biotin operon repressor/biotin-[acetyl-CoA-carboxylase] ligase
MADYSHLQQQLGDGVECFVFDSIPSTNDYLSALAFSKSPKICITREQTRGKGQYHRRWLSDKNSSILLSIRRVFPADISLSGLSLVAGMALIDTLNEAGFSGLKLKWPNDVYAADKKLAGILIENTIQGDYQSVVAGFGLNVVMQKSLCETPWIDLARLKSTQINLSELSKNLILNTLKYFDIFQKNGFDEFFEKWAKLDYLAGKKIDYISTTQPFKGVCVGINRQGILLVDTERGIREVYSSEFLRLC